MAAAFLVGIVAVALLFQHATRTQAGPPSDWQLANTGTVVPGVTGSTAHAIGPTPAGGFDQQTWAAALLAALGAPITQVNVENLIHWQAQEGGHWANNATYNPLNATVTLPDSTVMQGDTGRGIQAYSTWTQGLQATILQLQSSGAAIVAALQRSAPLGEFEAAVNNAGWGAQFG